MSTSKSLVICRTIACLLVLLSTSHALVIKNSGLQNLRFHDNIVGQQYTAPINPSFIGANYDLSGLSIYSDTANAGAMMISPHHFVTATHYRPGTTLYFRNRDDLLITKSIHSGRAMYRVFPDGDGQITDLWIGRLAGDGITAADKITTYPVIMEATNNWNWYLNRQIFIYGGWGNEAGINTINSVLDGGVAGRIGKSIRFNYSGAYTNQAGLIGESGCPWGVIVNNKFYAGGGHSGIYGTPSVTSNYDSISTFIPAFADQIDAYIAESHPGEKLTRVELVNDAPEVFGARSLLFDTQVTSETLYLKLVDDSFPLNPVITLTVSSSNQAILPNSALVLGGTGANRTLSVTPVAGSNGIVTVSLTTSDGEATAVKTFNVTVLGTVAQDAPVVSGDDAVQSIAGAVTITDSELRLGGGRLVGLRFPKLCVPSGAVVTSANVQFTSGVPQSGPASFEIFVHDSYGSGLFVGSAGPPNLSGRLLKPTSVLWQPTDWNTAGERGAPQRTSDITALIQQLVSQGYWLYGQPMALIFKGTGDRNADAQDKVGGQPAQLNVTFFVPKQNASFSVSSSADDAEQSSSGAVNLTDSDLELINDSVGGDQTVGVRFNNVVFPQGAILTGAAVQFAADKLSDGLTSLTIRGELSANPSPFTTTTNNLSSRPKTVSSISWPVSTWQAVGDQNYSQLTPDMTTMVSEVLNRPGWTSGNALAFFFTGTGRRTADSFDGIQAVPAKLKISYIIPQQPHSYETWMNSVPALTAAQRMPNADPDGDQLSNLMEFATGQNAAVPNASPLSVQTAPGQFHLVYSRPRSTYDITYVIEWTDDLAGNNWSSVGTTQQVIATNGVMQTYRAVIPMMQTNGNAAPRRFARLRVHLGTSPAGPEA